MSTALRYGRRIRRVLGGLRGQTGPGEVRGEHRITREKKKPPLVKTDIDSQVGWEGFVSKMFKQRLVCDHLDECLQRPSSCSDEVRR